MELKKIKVRAADGFNQYRCIVLGLSKKDFRALQAGKDALIPKKLFDKYKIFTKIDEVKDGN